MNDAVIKEESLGSALIRGEAAFGDSSPFGYVERGFSTAERWLSYLGLGFLIGLMGMVVAEVVSRYIFNSPIPGYLDLMEMMMAVLVFLTLAYCQREGGHIRMEIFMTRVLRGGRRYYLIEFAHLLFSLVAISVITYFTVVRAIEAYAIHDVSVTIRLVTWPAKSLIAIGAIFLCLRFILQMFQYGKLVISGVKKT